MTVRTSASSAIDDDDSTRWFDDYFASSVKPITERPPETFESLMQDVDDRAEHTELMASFGRVRRPAATARIPLGDQEEP